MLSDSINNTRYKIRGVDKDFKMFFNHIFGGMSLTLFHNKNRVSCKNGYQIENLHTKLCGVPISSDLLLSKTFLQKNSVVDFHGLP